MKIAVITPDFPPESIGGCAESALLLTNTLRVEHTVDVFAFHREHAPVETPQGTAWFFRGRPRLFLVNNWVMFWKLWNKLRSYDVIHVYNVTPVLAVVLLRLFSRTKRGAPIVMTLNNGNGAVASPVQYYKNRMLGRRSGRERFWEALKNETVPFGIAGAKWRYLEVQCIAWAGKRVQHYIALTDAMKQMYIEKGYTPEQFTVIPNMADSLFGQAAPQRDGVEQKEMLDVIYVSQLSSMKGQREFLEAFYALPEATRGRARVRLYGKGGIEDVLKSIIQSHENDVEIALAKHDELPGIYANADVAVQLSMYVEPFSRVWLESMQFGVPTLVSDTPGAREVFGDAALYCNPFDSVDVQKKLEQLLAQPELRTQLSVAARERVKQFAPTVVQDQLRAVYKEIEQAL